MAVFYAGSIIINYYIRNRKAANFLAYREALGSHLHLHFTNIFLPKLSS